MTHSSQNLTHEAYRDALISNDPQILAAFYAEFRPAVVRAITHQGGSAADGPVFFQLALLEAARLAHQQLQSSETPIPAQLTALARAHYADWLSERGQNLTSEPEASFDLPDEDDAAGDFTETPPEIPDQELLRETRHKVFAWKRMEQLRPECRHTIMETGEGEENDPVRTDCLNQWRESLQHAGLVEGPNGLPGWAEAARTDAAGYQLWHRLRGFEQRLSAGEPLLGEPARARSGPVVVAVLAAVALMTAGLFYWFYQTKTPGQVYRDNFQPPASIVADRQSRQEALVDADSAAVMPLECDPMFEEADRYFSQKDYRGAMEPLTYMLAEAPPECHSDVLFYLGIVGLQLEDPGLALECFSKIEDLDRYGEDIYWYQALTFVKLAQANPLLEEKARRAVERAISNIHNEDRRRQAEEMLRNLSK